MKSLAVGQAQEDFALILVANIPNLLEVYFGFVQELLAHFIKNGLIDILTGGDVFEKDCACDLNKKWIVSGNIDNKRSIRFEGHRKRWKAY